MGSNAASTYLRKVPMSSFDRDNFLLSLGLVLGIFALLILGRLLMYFERRGWVRLRRGYRRSSGIGNCFLNAEILAKPQIQHVVEAKKNVRGPIRRKARRGGGASGK